MRYLRNVPVLLLASAAFLAAQSDPPGRVGRLNFMSGPVSFQTGEEQDWYDASLNRPLVPGDNIWVGEGGRAEIHVGSTAFRLGPNTAFQFLNLDDGGVQIRLSEGTLNVRLRDLQRGEYYEIDTPNAAFSLIRPGDYRIDADADSQTTYLTVRNGEGEVTGSNQQFNLRAGQQAALSGEGDNVSYDVGRAPQLDSWDQWCATRAQREDQSQSAQYVSPDMTGYEDLDQYGRWSNEGGYGQVWMPNNMAADWAPYRDGHWAWIAPWGWTWIDDAPWGFAPYHYGRWASIRGRWGWIPGPRGPRPVYAPALVAWIGGGGGFNMSVSIGGGGPSVGWFPLGPREPYIPSYRVSERYFTRLNTSHTSFDRGRLNDYYRYNSNPERGQITNVRYVNRNVQNSVIVVSQNTFVTGRRVGREARNIPPSQLGSVQVFGAASIAPRRESVIGFREGGRAAARPPAQVISRQVVARRTPPPAAVPFARQQAPVAGNPGRPPTMQQMRQGSAGPSGAVRIVDMGRVKRQQPQVSAGQPRGRDGRQDQRPAQQQQTQPQPQPAPSGAVPIQPQQPQPQRQVPPPTQQEQQRRRNDNRQDRPERPRPPERQQAPPPVPQPQPQPQPPQQQQQQQQQERERRRNEEKQNRPERQRPPQPQPQPPQAPPQQQPQPQPRPQEQRPQRPERQERREQKQDKGKPAKPDKEKQDR